MKRAGAPAIVVAAIALALSLGALRGDKDEGARCGPGLVARGPRCEIPVATCPPPLAPNSEHVCDAPDVTVFVPAATVLIGPSDWEATGERPRLVHAEAFRIDAFEVTLGHWDASTVVDAARAASGMPRAAAESYCRRRGGRLPSEDEWIVAAVSASATVRRYPWGDTGAVCRRAAWGLATGPCARGADGPDTVGAHPGGDTPLGLHDMAGNVAEWVAPDPRAPAARAVARGGSWRTELASELRVWSRLELSPDARDPAIGLRCAYPP